jgi:hypothetical protein
MRTCLFCYTHLTRSNRSKEHVFPKWLVSRLKAQDEKFVGTVWTYPNEPTVIFDEREHDALSLVLGKVCEGCNTGWMAQLEVDTRPILEALWDARNPPVLTLEQCNSLSKWTFKTAATLNYSANYKRIVPLDHVRQFHAKHRLPENATVDLAFSYRDGIHWIVGGNTKFVTLSGRITNSQKRATYVITLQFDHVLLRLAWVPVDKVKAIAAPTSAVNRIFPQGNAVQVVRRHIFRDHAQFHFTATVLAEEGVYPNDLDF